MSARLLPTTLASALVVLRMKRTSLMIWVPDWLDRLDLMIAVEDQFAGVEITDDDVDRMEVVGDLIRHIETMDTERRRRGVAPVIRKLFGPRLARAVKSAKQPVLRASSPVFLRLAGDAMRSLVGWCPETRNVKLKINRLYDATLARIWSNVLRFQCPHCGTKHETKVQRLASKPFSLEPPQRARHQHTAVVGATQVGDQRVGAGVAHPWSA
jgi:hypothetical protein